jgi:hypothetical protein
MDHTFGVLNARTVRALDVGLAVWLVVWLVLGVVVWHDVGTQARLSQSVVKVGRAVKQTGDALALIGAVPLVGTGIRELAGRVQRDGADVQARGRQSEQAIHRIAVITGLAVAVLPAALVLLLYLPPRLLWRRDRRALSTALRGRGDDPALEQYLARRAIASLSWARLRELSDDPWRDVTAGHWRDLADAELARLGLQRSR